MTATRIRRFAAIVALGASLVLSASAARADDPIVGLPIGAAIHPPSPCADDDITIQYTACGPCARIDFASLDSVVVTQRADVPCPLVPCPNEVRGVPLGRLAPGSHRITILLVLRTVMPDSSVAVRREYRVLEFDVRRECTGTIGLPYVSQVTIGSRPAPCDTCPPIVCAGDSVRVHLEGRLPSACWSVRSVEWLPIMSPVDLPVLMVTIADSTCSAIPECWLPGTGWEATRWLPPTSVGRHPLVVSVMQVTCDSLRAPASVPPPPVSRRFVYEVVDSCGGPPVTGCVEGTLGRFDGWFGDVRCDAFRDAEGFATVDLELKTFEALGGIEGSVRVPMSAQLLGLETTGPATGMTLVTRPTSDRGEPGLNFVLFGLRGQVIPPGTWPVLRARVRVPLEARATILGGWISVASDSLGGEVPICVHVVPDGRPVGVCAPRADSCDANGDGVTNVRDLVRMARCLTFQRVCFPGGPLDWDCNHDGAFGVPDLICCARRILGGGGPDTSAVRPIDGVALEMGEPVRGVRDVRVPLRLMGADRLGAAVLRFEYPADRYEVEGVEFTDSPEWLQVSDASSAGRAEIGFVALGGATASERPATVRLRLRDGASHGGVLRVRDYELSDLEGARVSAPLDGAQIVLGVDGEAGEVALSAGRPNPSGGVARFAVSLPRAADVDLGVFDVTGRRVATLVAGRLSAGAREFAWDARGVRDGVYFARLVVDGRTYGSRVTLLRQR